MAYLTSIILTCILLLNLILIANSVELEADECKRPTKLQVVFLVDGSLPQGTNWPMIQTEITKEVARLAEKKQLPNVEYGLVSYHTGKGDENKTNCYTLVQPLSSKSDEMLSNLELPGESDTDMLKSECSLSSALLLAVKDEKVKWDTNKDDDSIKRIIIAYTVKPLGAKLSGNGSLLRRDSIGDGSDTCENSNPPTADVLKKVIEENKILVLLQVFLPNGRVEEMEESYSKKETSPFHKFSNENICLQYYGRTESVTASSTYWMPETSANEVIKNETVAGKDNKTILEAGEGFREEDVTPEDLLKRAKFLFKKCLMKRICLRSEKKRSTKQKAKFRQQGGRSHGKHGKRTSTSDSGEDSYALDENQPSSSSSSSQSHVSKTETIQIHQANSAPPPPTYAVMPSPSSHAHVQKIETIQVQNSQSAQSPPNPVASASKVSQYQTTIEIQNANSAQSQPSPGMPTQPNSHVSKQTQIEIQNSNSAPPPPPYAVMPPPPPSSISIMHPPPPPPYSVHPPPPPPSTSISVTSSGSPPHSPGMPPPPPSSISIVPPPPPSPFSFQSPPPPPPITIVPPPPGQPFSFPPPPPPALIPVLPQPHPALVPSLSPPPALHISIYSPPPAPPVPIYHPPPPQPYPVYIPAPPPPHIISAPAPTNHLMFPPGTPHHSMMPSADPHNPMMPPADPHHPMMPSADPHHSRMPSADPNHPRMPPGAPHHSMMPSADPNHPRMPPGAPHHSMMPSADPNHPRMPPGAPRHSMMPSNDPEHTMTPPDAHAPLMPPDSPPQKALPEGRNFGLKHIPKPLPTSDSDEGGFIPDTKSPVSITRVPRPTPLPFHMGPPHPSPTCFTKIFPAPTESTPTASHIRPNFSGRSLAVHTEVVEKFEEACNLDDSELPNVQVLFLVDGSLAHGSNWTIISQDMTKEISRLIQEKLQRSGSNVEFAVASYFSSHGDESSGGKCYSLLQPFTNDPQSITQKIGELGHSHTDVYAECSLTLALLLAIKDSHLQWNNDLITVDTKATRKFIIVYPMRVSSTTSSGAKREPYGDGADTCENSKPPQAETLKQVVYNNNVYILLGTFLLQGKEDQVGKFYSSDISSPFRLFSEDTACSMYYAAQNSVTGHGRFWKMTNKKPSTTEPYKFSTNVGMGFNEDTINHEDILKRASLLYLNCFLPEFIACDWEDPPGYNTLGL